MSETKKIEVVQPKLEEYPVRQEKGKFEILSAYTFYRFNDKPNGRWQAILKTKTTSGDGKVYVNVGVYRWVWKKYSYYDRTEKKRVETGEFKWLPEQMLTVNDKTRWNIIANKMDEFTEGLSK